MDFSGTIRNNSFGPAIWPYVQPPIIESCWFERFDVVNQLAWFQKNWTLSIYICIVYLLLVFTGKSFMNTRQAFDLQGPLAIWNFGLAVFSIAGLIRCVPELLFVLNGNNGFHRSVGVRDSHSEPGAFWAWVFMLSKVVELGDTAFIVLRKKPVLFVHYFHHGTALIVSWFFYSLYEPIDRYIGISNCFCHSILYGYMFFKTVGVKIPKPFAKVLMSVEVLQMIIGVFVNCYASMVKMRGQPCEHRTDSIIIQTVLYLMFVLVFGYYFVSYKKQRKELNKKSK